MIVFHYKIFWDTGLITVAAMSCMFYETDFFGFACCFLIEKCILNQAIKFYMFISNDESFI